MTIDMDGVRERLTLCAEGPVPGPEWSTEPGLDAVAVGRDDLRALLDDHARMRAELCDVLAERDAMQAMATQNGRERNRAEAEVERLTRERDGWRLRADDLSSARDGAERDAAAARAEVAWLAPALAERPHAVAVGSDPMSQALADVARLTRERDEARSALSVRYALAREVEALLGVPEGPAGPEALREAAYIADACASAGMSAGDAAERIRAEAERIERGGR